MTIAVVPWIDLVILTPLLGALWTIRYTEKESAHQSQVWFALITMVFAVMAWLTSGSSSALTHHVDVSWMGPLISDKALSLDELSAPLVPLAALLFLMVSLATVRTKFRSVSFPAILFSEAITLATLCCREPWGIIGLLAVGTIPPVIEYQKRGRSPRNFLFHMSVFISCLTVAWAILDWQGTSSPASLFPLALLTLAIFIRNGVAPFHCWMTDLFENVSLGSALLFVTPMAGAYAAARLLLPVATPEILHVVALMSLATAVYAAGMALVQTEARRFFCYLYLSHKSLVLVGLGIATPMSLTGSLCVWFSINIALAGFGLTLRAIEARMGRISLREYHGLYDQTPRLAVFFLLTGLASVGFPGTIGFVATEILVDSVVQAYPLIGMGVVLAAALNGIAVMQAYFRLFTGAKHAATINLRSRFKERIAIMTMTLLIIFGGLVPQPGIASRYHAAVELLHDTPAAQFHPEHADTSNAATHLANHGASARDAKGGNN